MTTVRELERNKQLIYYALYEGKVDKVDKSGYKTGEKVKTYSDPVPLRINVSPARGNADRDGFGIDLNYSRTMSTADVDCPIAEDSLLWIGIEPTAPHNYVVVRKAVSFHDIVYAIREVTLSG